MKAIVCKQWGQPEDLVLEDVPSLEIGDDEVLIAVHACSVNFADTLIIAGLYQEKPELPFTPGAEVAGEVLAVGVGVQHVKPGDRVAALCSNGGFAAEAKANAMSVMPIPDNMDYVSAAAFPIAYGTAHVALAHRGQLQAGETLLVHGASGGVGLAAVEIGKQMGATVIATASTTAKLTLAQAHGADHVINYREGEFRNQVKELTDGKGADVIFDPVGGDVFDQSTRCINWEGRIIVVGFAAGRIPQLPVNLALVKNFSVVGVYWGRYAKQNPQVLTDSLATLLGWYAMGKLKPHVTQTFALTETPAALRTLMDRKALGKVVVKTR